MEDYKLIYNKLLSRYNNGIEYITKNPDQREKWIPEIKKIMQELNDLIMKHSIPTENILTGFEVE